MTNASVVDAKLFDSAAIVQMLNPGTVKTFQEYAALCISTAVNSPESGCCLG